LDEKERTNRYIVCLSFFVFRKHKISDIKVCYFNVSFRENGTWVGRKEKPDIFICELKML